MTNLASGVESPPTFNMREFAMNYWIMSDTHFGHDKIIKNGYRHSDAYSKMINSVKNLSENDVLIHLGDFSFYNCEQWHELFMGACKCKRWLIKGNHDRRTNAWYLAHGWDFVADSIQMNIFGKVIFFTHAPISTIHDSINVHGHLHDCTWRSDENLTDYHFLVKMEHDYKPVNLRKLIGM